MDVKWRETHLSGNGARGQFDLLYFPDPFQNLSNRFALEDVRQETSGRKIHRPSHTSSIASVHDAGREINRSPPRRESFHILQNGSYFFISALDCPFRDEFVVISI